MQKFNWFARFKTPFINSLNRGVTPQVIYPALFILTAVVYLIGMFCIPMMEIDAAQYASISEQMIREQSWLQIKHMESEYLDKPPLLFWFAAAFIRVLGYHSFAYKLCSVLASGLAVYSTYRFSRLYYSQDVAKMAALVLASCQAFFIIAQDCRTDNLLIGFCCFAIWKISSYILNRKDIDLYLGFIGIGLAMLAKGPLGLIFPVFTIGCIILHPKNIRSLTIKWMWSIPIVLLMLTPMCIGLYLQHGWKGIEFYFWTQSFGRITGQSTWANDSGPLYFVHTFLWSFLPCSLILLAAVWTCFKDMTFAKKPLPEYGTIGGMVLTFVALSLSKYKLPHYIYIICPLAAILTARYVLEEVNGWNASKWFKLAQLFLLIGLATIPIVVAYLFTDSFLTIAFLSIPGLIIGYWFIYTYGESKKQLIYYSILTAIIGNLILNAVFYPRLLKYQSSSELAFYMLEQKIPAEQLVAYKKYGHALSYYLHTGIPYETDLTQALGQPQSRYIYTSALGLSDLKLANIPFEIIKEFDDFPVSRLNFKFINPATRHSAVATAFLIQLKP